MRLLYKVKCWRIINLSCDNVRASTQLYNLSDNEEWHYGRAGRRTTYPLSLLECFHRTVSASCKEIANRNGNFASKWFVFAMNIHLKIRLTRINEMKKKLHDVFIRPMHMYFTCHQLVFDHPAWLCDTVRSAVRRQQLELPQYRVPPPPPTMKRTDAIQVGKAWCKSRDDMCYWWFLRSYLPQMLTTTAGEFVRNSPFRRQQSAYTDAIHRAVTSPFSWSYTAATAGPQPRCWLRSTAMLRVPSSRQKCLKCPS
jgi:hypothetical protein